MDELLLSFHRQYLQQVLPSNIRYPPAKLLVESDIQHQIHKYFFDAGATEYLPPPHYQRKVLKKIIHDIENELEKSVYEGLEYAVSDDLMSHMGEISAIPPQPESESAQMVRTLSYFLPAQSLQHTAFPESSPQQRILIRESPNLLAAGSNVGLRTWEACLHLAYYLSTCPDLASRHLAGRGIQGANIVELGAGTGLLSLICALSLGADHVLATDGLAHVVAGIESNVNLNIRETAPTNGGEPMPVVLDWTNTGNLNELLRVHGQLPTYDYILGADITYHPELFDPLARILKILKVKFPNARVLISATVRNEATLAQFQSTCTDVHGLSIRTIPENEWNCPTFRDQTGLFHEQAFPIIIMDIGLQQ